MGDPVAPLVVAPIVVVGGPGGGGGGGWRRWGVRGAPSSRTAGTIVPNGPSKKYPGQRRCGATARLCCGAAERVPTHPCRIRAHLSGGIFLLSSGPRPRGNVERSGGPPRPSSGCVSPVGVGGGIGSDVPPSPDIVLLVCVLVCSGEDFRCGLTHCCRNFVNFSRR